MRVGSPAALPDLAGEEIGLSSWHRLGADRVAAFAGVTGDDQWIHVDAERAAAGPYGGRVVHGMLLVALLPTMIVEVLTVDGVALVLNKGLGGVRLTAPVRVGDRVRGRVVLAAARSRPRGFHEATFAVTVESEASGVAAARAEVTFLYQQ